jgi:hypothetical protein
MKSTHLIGNNNQGLNILLNLYGTDWWIDLIVSHEIVEVNFHAKVLGFCEISSWGAVEKDRIS